MRNFPRNKYSVSTRRHGIEWEWEIVRNDPHKFEASAFKEGTAALNEFLAFLKRERSAW